MTEITIGIDVSKDHLDAYRLPEGDAERFTNDAAGLKALRRWIGRKAVARILFEATGPYTRALEQLLDRANLPRVKVNPRQARRFAEAVGTLTKTDPVDAAILARMGAALELAPQTPASPTLIALKELHQARRALVKDRVAAKTRAKMLCLALLRRHNAERLRQIDRQILAVDDAIRTLVQRDENLARQVAILTTMPGIATITACALIAELPELGQIDHKQLASLAGLAPHARQSGRWTGHVTIRGGRANLRRALYMPALNACRYNPDLKAKYQQLIASGKPPKVAITAVMRKLLITANAIVRDNRSWDNYYT